MSVLLKKDRAVDYCGVVAAVNRSSSGVDIIMFVPALLLYEKPDFTLLNEGESRRK